MSNNTISAEDKIFQAAHHIFLLYGYHRTTLQKIALEARLNKSSIHYYFRSKERLYAKVVEYVPDLILSSEFLYVTNRKRFEKCGRLLFTELYNNEERFERTVEELYPDNRNKKISEIKKWFELATCP